MKAAGLDAKYKLDPSCEAALQELYKDFVSNAISFGCSNAKRRQVGVLGVCVGGAGR